MGWLDLTKLLSGFLLAIALVVGGSTYAVQYVIAQFTTPPPRPTFPNDKPAAKAKPVSAPAKPSPKPSPSPSPSPTPSETPSPKPTEAAGYPARITQPMGLNIREGPSVDANRLSGVDYDQQVIVLEDSEDKEWQRVRVEGTDIQGWIKSGYTERVN
jgi:cytoskeletal protein RodZ